MEGSELLKYQLNLMANDQPSIGFNVFFHEQFFNAGTSSSKKNLEQTEKIIEQWKKLTDEDKMQWQQKEEELKNQIKNKNSQKSKQSQTRQDNQNRSKSNGNVQEHKAIEEIQNSIQSLKFDEAKQNYKKRISEKLQEVKDINDQNEDKHVEKDEKIQQQQNNKKNTSRKKKESLDKEDNDEDYVVAIKESKKSNARQSKPRTSRTRPKSGQKSGCGKRRM
ncbi:unnamed protein product [Paramecium sonneborni]|uniref:Uncharacterized protein n=1 Tax=Paramecium sonneborni TaxID=65129 RepID=A0A8S1PGP5_9CILI|nr:unnamed protein product [Paramecium sonneborni]